MVCVDQSREAGERCLRNAERNKVADRVTFERADALDDLKRRADSGERWGIVVCDPPPFARSRREVDGAERGYVEVNRRAIALCGEDGLVATASCSHNVRPEQFRAWLGRAAVRARREVFLERETGASPDHPVRLELPESSYLKCAFLRVS